MPCQARAVTDGDKCAFHKDGKVGEPQKLTPELAEQLVSLLRAGNYVAVAVRATGISRALFYQWLDRGASDAPEDAEYAELRARVEEAKAHAEARHVANIANAARENWQAAAWLLERMYPERWGRVSVRVRDAAVDAAQPNETTTPDDPFAEVDDLAAARRRRVQTGT
jgi:hypothetical protein